MMRRLLASAIAAAIAQCCFAASSEEDLLLSFGEEEFLSIATGQKQLIAKAPAVATVITAEDIEAIGATTLEEILETVPGVHVSLSSTVLSPIISVRGIYTDKNPQVLTLVNGVPMTHLHLGDRGGRTSFPVRDIARVEVIRGPGSAVYGADALAGVNLALKPWGFKYKVEDLKDTGEDVKNGGAQIEYQDQNPEIHQIFFGECKTRGAVPRMPMFDK